MFAFLPITQASSESDKFASDLVNSLQNGASLNSGQKIFTASVAFGQAKYYTDNLRENIFRGIRQKIRRGEMPAKAPLGYYNEPRICTIEPDKATFNKMKKILELFAKGNHTLTKIQDEMFSAGLVGRYGKPHSLSSIPAILSNPFYYGMFMHKGELIQGSHKPMISKKLF